MRLVTFRDTRGARVGLLQENGVVDLQMLLGANRRNDPPYDLQWVCDMHSLIDAGAQALATIRQAVGQPGSSLVASALLPLDGLRLLAPIPRPRKNVFAVGLNYHEHRRETAEVRGPLAEPPAHPVFFTKPGTAVIGPDDSILLDARVTQQLDYEVELGVVIGRKGINIPEDQALHYVFGYTVINDVSARDLQRRHGQWFKGKSLDTTCPMGPCIVLAEDLPAPQNLDLTLRLNDEVMQSSNTHEMIFTVARLISVLSSGMTLEPGDIIATGTPSGVGTARQPAIYLKDGDRVEAEVAGIGVLRNRVMALAPAD